MRSVKRWRVQTTVNAEHAEHAEDFLCYLFSARSASFAWIVVSPDAEQQINHELIEFFVRERA